MRRQPYASGRGIRRTRLTRNGKREESFRSMPTTARRIPSAKCSAKLNVRGETSTISATAPPAKFPDAGSDANASTNRRSTRSRHPRRRERVTTPSYGGRGRGQARGGRELIGRAVFRDADEHVVGKRPAVGEPRRGIDQGDEVLRELVMPRAASPSRNICATSPGHWNRPLHREGRTRPRPRRPLPRGLKCSCNMNAPSNGAGRAVKRLSE